MKKGLVLSVSALVSPWKQVWTLPLIRKLGLGTIVAIVLSLVVVAWWWRRLPPEVPLWYSRAWGQDQLASPFWLLLLPGASLLFMSISLTLASRVMEARIFAKLLILAAFLVATLSLVTLVRIVLLVT